MARDWGQGRPDWSAPSTMPGDRTLRNRLRNYPYNNLGSPPPPKNEQERIDRLRRLDMIMSFKRGGRVKRTGIYKLHRGEHVVPARHKRRSRRT